MIFQGLAVSPGVAVGQVYRLEGPFGSSERRYLETDALIPAEIKRLDRALADAAAELDQIVKKVELQLGQFEADIFRSHLNMIRDPSLLAKVHHEIEEHQLTATSALQVAISDYASIFARGGQDFFQERMADLRDVVARISSHLESERPVPHSTGPTETEESLILVAHELLPSQALNLMNLAISGIVTEVGGGTSHAAILSRSRGIPAVTGVPGLTQKARSTDRIIVDGRDGRVLLRPDAETTSTYRKMQRDFVQVKDRLVSNRDQPATLQDGTVIELLANINTSKDADAAVGVGAEGVGLYRTEYLFLTHPAIPDEEEQYEDYRKVVESAPNRQATIRTLDLGGDKTVAYLGRSYETNPFMGWRSIRMAFEHPRFFETQLRAILRAACHGRVSMLFPMITTLEEVRAVNRMVVQARTHLQELGVPCGDSVKTGIMIEVPAAAICIDALLQETDFICIGSNDLVQYLSAADRDNPKVAHLCDPLNPAFLRMLRMILDACRRTGTPATLCGEMAGQPRAVLALLGLGLRKFSMSPAFVPTIKELLSSVSIAQAERFAHQVLQLKTREEIHDYLTERLHEVSKDLEPLSF